MDKRKKEDDIRALKQLIAKREGAMGAKSERGMGSPTPAASSSSPSRHTKAPAVRGTVERVEQRERKPDEREEEREREREKPLARLCADKVDEERSIVWERNEATRERERRDESRDEAGGTKKIKADEQKK